MERIAVPGPVMVRRLQLPVGTGWVRLRGVLPRMCSPAGFWVDGDEQADVVGWRCTEKHASAADELMSFTSTGLVHCSDVGSLHQALVH